MPFLKIGAGKSSRGSRPGLATRAIYRPACRRLTFEPLGDVDHIDRVQLRLKFLLRTLVIDHIRREADVVEYLRRQRVAFGMDPGAVQRIGTVGDFQEARRLDEARRTEAWHLQQRFTRRERAMLFAVVDQFPRHQLIHTGDMPQQRHARRIEIDAHLIDARLDHGFERFLEFLAAHVVLIKADADVLRIDFDQFAQGILQAPADRDGAAQGRVKFGKLFPADRADGIDARPRLVDDDIREVRRTGGDQLGDQLFRLAAAGAIAQRRRLANDAC